MDAKEFPESSIDQASKDQVETVVIEAGHGYVDLLDASSVDKPAPDEEMVYAVQDVLDEYGVDYQLVHIADDTSGDLNPEQMASKHEIVGDYLEDWSIEPEQVCWESEAASVWENGWKDYQGLDNVKGSSKNVPFTCAALDAAMTAEKLDETDQTSIPGADLAVTQHDENLPVPSIGGYSSFQGYEGQITSHQIQEELYKLGALEDKTWSQGSNLEYNPEEKTVDELAQELEEVIS